MNQKQLDEVLKRLADYGVDIHKDGTLWESNTDFFDFFNFGGSFEELPEAMEYAISALWETAYSGWWCTSDLQARNSKLVSALRVCMLALNNLAGGSEAAKTALTKGKEALAFKPNGYIENIYTQPYSQLAKNKKRPEVDLEKLEPKINALWNPEEGYGVLSTEQTDDD